MKTSSSRCQGSALVTTAIFSAIATLMLGSVLMWAKNHGRLVLRQAEFAKAQYVAEAGTEKMFAAIRSNAYATGQSPSQAVLDSISTNQIPTTTDSSSFASYRFVSVSGVTNQITVRTNGTPYTAALPSGTWAGLTAIVTPYLITARANSFNRPVNLTTGIQRNMQIQSVPVFQFAIFYNMDMEIENGQQMTVNGRVHSNGNAYFAPNSTLEFQDEVSVVQNAYNNPMPGDTHQPTYNSPVYNDSLVTGVNTLNLPLEQQLGASFDPHDIIEPAPASGDTLGTQRVYNQAGLRITVSNSGVTAKDSAGNNVSGITVGTSASSILSTNDEFYDAREGVTVAVTELNIGNLISANKVPANNNIVYVNDTRTSARLGNGPNDPKETVVRLINGDTLPNAGLTVASANPVYIQGNYNSVYDRPAAVFADAITILSGSWNDAQSSHSLSSRNASSTTIDAALFTGIVKTDTVNNHYSGGVENLMRLLEDWSGDTLTYNGSLVVMFPSATATGIWKNTGSGNNVYNAPTRNWAFDVNFLGSGGLPPGTCYVRILSRGTWASVN